MNRNSGTTWLEYSPVVAFAPNRIEAKYTSLRGKRYANHIQNFSIFIRPLLSVGGSRRTASKAFHPARSR
jgi:hypothetical protein